jgi:hypothetical protein
MCLCECETPCPIWVQLRLVCLDTFALWPPTHLNIQQSMQTPLFCVRVS